MSASGAAPRSPLFTPVEIRGVCARDRGVVPPMCLYSAEHGFANDWHFVHCGKLAVGAAGIVTVEAIGVSSWTGGSPTAARGPGATRRSRRCGASAQAGALGGSSR